jgi:hypothetical protein
VGTRSVFADAQVSDAGIFKVGGKVTAIGDPSLKPAKEFVDTTLVQPIRSDTLTVSVENRFRRPIAMVPVYTLSYQALGQVNMEALQAEVLCIENNA